MDLPVAYLVFVCSGGVVCHAHHVVKLFSELLRFAEASYVRVQPQNPGGGVSNSYVGDVCHFLVCGAAFARAPGALVLHVRFCVGLFFFFPGLLLLFRCLDLPTCHEHRYLCKFLACKCLVWWFAE